MSAPIRVVVGDKALIPRDTQVYLLLREELDTERYRPIKQRWLAAALGASRNTIRRSLQRLVEQHYLERALPVVRGAEEQYRLRATCGTPSQDRAQNSA